MYANFVDKRICTIPDDKQIVKTSPVVLSINKENCAVDGPDKNIFREYIDFLTFIYIYKN